jgi:uncharacterized membrane protein YfcA
MSMLIFIIIGIITGVTFGFIGDGATAAVVPLLVFLKAVPSIKHAIGTSMGMLLPPVGITGAYLYYKDGYVNTKGALTMAIMFMISAYFSTKYAKKTDEKKIKNGLALFLVLLGIATYFTPMGVKSRKR